MEFPGIGTPIRRGLGGTSVLKWSPTGDYFFSGKLYGLTHLLSFMPNFDETCQLMSLSCCSDGTFYLWETNTWTSEPWSSASGFVTVSDYF